MSRLHLIRLRRDTSSNWATENPTPEAGEPCFDYESNILKIGDGTTPYSQLAGVLPNLSTSVIGVEWDTSSSSPTLTQIDINGNTITPSTSDFDNHAVFGNMRRCVIDSDGNVE